MMHNTVYLIKNHFPLIFCLFFLWVAASCEEQASCVTTNTNNIQINFFKIDTTGNGQSTDTYSNISLFAANGTPLFTDSSSATYFEAPLNPSTNQTFVVLQQDSVVDTIYLAYNREQLVVSPECGVEQRFYNLQASSTLDSIRVLETDINSTDVPQVGIYTCRYTLDDTIKLSFYKFVSDENTTSVTSQRDTLDIVSIVNDQNDVILQNQDSVLTAAFPVYPNQTQIALTITRRLADSTTQVSQFSVDYQKTNPIISKCLPQVRYDLLEDGFTLNNVDSLVFTNTVLDTTNSENIRVFLPSDTTATNE